MTFFNSLERLYLVSNKISKIENLDCCPNLNMLELGDNKIRKVNCRLTPANKLNFGCLIQLMALQVENLENLKHLKELYLGR